MQTALQDDQASDLARAHTRYRVAMLAPPWLAVPPPGYGPLGWAISRLCEGLVRRGHDVTLFAAPGSRTPANLHKAAPGHPYPSQQWLDDIDHVAQVSAVINQAADEGQPFDLLHHHGDFTALAMATPIPIPVVHTIRGPITAEMADLYDLYAPHAHAVQLVATSQAQLVDFPPDLQIGGVVPDPIDLQEWPYQPHKQDYVLWIGGFDDLKIAEKAIAVAHAAQVPLVLTGPVLRGHERYFGAHIAPHLTDHRVRHLGEVSSRRQQQLITDARALLVPLHSAGERHRSLMLGSLASGTPVITFPNGGAMDVVRDNVNGYLVNDEEAMAAAITTAGRLNPAACRASVEARFDVDAVAARYEGIYRQAIRRGLLSVG